MEFDCNAPTDLRKLYGEKLDQDFMPEIDSETFENLMPRYFGADPTDLKFQYIHPKPRFVSDFMITKFIDNGNASTVHYLVSWSNSLRFERFLRTFPDLVYTQYTIKVNSKLIRFDLNRYYRQLKEDFNILPTYDDISWNDLDDSGIIKLRSKKSVS